MTNSRHSPGVMFWYHHEAGGHTHVRVFLNGGKCGDLCFENEEFAAIRRAFGDSNFPIQLIPETFNDYVFGNEG